MNAAIQEERAVLCLQLHQLCRRPPPEVVNGPVQTTRQWLARLKVARQVKGNPFASRRELQQAIERMRLPAEGPEA